MLKQIHKYFKIGFGLLLILFVAIIYRTVFVKSTGGGDMIALFLFLCFGVILGGIVVYYSQKNTSKNLQRESSHTIQESMKKVFKIVCVEGFFSELFDYEETKTILSIFPSTKKALLKVKAKVLIGYDFAKCVWEIDEDSKNVKILSYPEPEILSMEPDIEYYSLEEGIFNRFEKNDHKALQDNAKNHIIKAVEQSDLKQIANQQIRTMMKELVSSYEWKLIDN